MFIISCFLVVVSQLICSAMNGRGQSLQAVRLETGRQGTAIYDGEYEFIPPPSPWELIRRRNDFVFGF
jgi:hypothetical protein